MSRIGKKPVKIPSGVKASVTGNKLAVEGKLGKLEYRLPPRDQDECRHGGGLVQVGARPRPVRPVPCTG